MIPFDEALAALKNCDCPEDKIIQSSAYWIPLQWVYVRMVENKDLVALSDLKREHKERYWRQVRHLEAAQWKKICLAQALYCYEVIK